MVQRGLIFLAAWMVLMVAGPWSPAAGAAEGLYGALTADGMELKLLRYAPPGGEPREGAQPVLIFPGIMCNMNIYLSHTPAARAADYAGMALQDPLASWAVGDSFIAEDPLRYYSIAHYLWLTGYDPWFANYRGTGRGEFASEFQSGLTTLDVWGALDVPACIDKVYEVTGAYPVIGGHSTGGFVCFAYLQGAYMDPDELARGLQEGYLPHISPDAERAQELADERNARIPGFIAIDPGCVPRVPPEIDTYLMWLLFTTPLYLDLDTLMEELVNPLISDSGVMIASIDLIFGTIFEMDRLIGDYLEVLSYLNFWNTNNMHPYVEDYFARYGASSTYIRGLAQWGDIALRDRIREHWMNGEENCDTVVGPQPDPPEDGYYYYDLHMQRVRVPTIAVLSSYPGLVDSEDVIEGLMEAKTPHALDEWHVIPNSAHADIPCGLNAPHITFPLIGDWLSRVTSARQPSEETARDENETLADSGSTPALLGQDDDGLCFIAATRVRLRGE